MINISNDFKTAMKQPVKEIQAYIIANGTEIRSENDLIQFKISAESGLCKTAMRKLEAKILGDYNLLGQWVQVGFGVRLPNGSFEYLDYGSFLVTEITSVKDSETTTIIGYDKMILSMTKYHAMSIDYPIKLINYTKLLCNTCGLELGNDIFGKNLLPNNKTSGSSRGITFTPNNDGTYLINGKSNSSSNNSVLIIYNGEINIKAGTYYYIPSGDSNCGVSFRVTYVDDTMKYFDLYTKTSVTIPKDIKSIIIYLQVRNGTITTYENFKVYPMLSTTPVTVTDYKLYNEMNDWLITQELWENIDGITYRDIFQQIAQVTGSTVIISNDDKIYFKPINKTGDSLTYDNMFKLKLEPIYGEINSIILSRTPQEDNIYMQDTESINKAVGKNLFDKSRITPNKILSRNTGTTSTDTRYGVSDYIPVEPNTTYTEQGFNVWYSACYDKDYKYIGYIENKATFTTLENTKYIRLSLLLTNLDTAQFEKGDIATSYEEFKSQGVTEFRIENNEIIDKDRDNAMTPIFNSLNGINYYPFETTTEGLGWYEIADNFDIINNAGDVFNTSLFNFSITIDGGIKETLKTVAETKTQTQYQYASTIAKRVKNTEIVTNKQQQYIEALVTDMYEDNGIIHENFTNVYQDINNIIQSVQNSGGNNLLKNSVMFGYDSDGNPNEWTVEGNGTLSIQSSTEAMSNGSLSGHIFILNNKIVRQRVYVKSNNTSSEKTYYTFSTRIKKNTTGSCYVKIYNNNENYEISIPVGENAFYKEYELKALLPTDTYYDIEFYGSADSDATFTDNMFSVGEYKTQWSQASGEIMNTQVNVNVDGVLVKSSIYAGDYTVMSPLEFAGYSNINGTVTKVFTINKDTTEVEKLLAKKGMTMPPIKIVPVTTGSLQGWAFVPSTE